MAVTICNVIFGAKSEAESRARVDGQKRWEA